MVESPANQPLNKRGRRSEKPGVNLSQRSNRSYPLGNERRQQRRKSRERMKGFCEIAEQLTSHDSAKRLPSLSSRFDKSA
jgi:hypothetical protein